MITIANGGIIVAYAYKTVEGAFHLRCNACQREFEAETGHHEKSLCEWTRKKVGETRILCPSRNDFFCPFCQKEQAR